MELKKDKKGRVEIPEFERIKREDLLPGDVLLFLNGNWLTEWHGKSRKKKYGRSAKPPYHAAIVHSVDSIPIFDDADNVVGNEPCVFILDPEISTSLSFLREYTQKKNVRIDIVRFKATKAERSAIQAKIKEVGSKEGLYDWKGYGGFASQMPWWGWLFSWVKPSKKNFFCSDAATYCVQSSTDIRVSPRENNFTAPVDNQLYGMEHHKLYIVKAKGEVL